MAARLLFEPATLRMQGTEPTTEPPHSQLLSKEEPSGVTSRSCCKKPTDIV